MSIAWWHRFSAPTEAGVGVDDVGPAMVVLDRLEEAVQVGRAAGVGLHAGHRAGRGGVDRRDGLVEFVLAAAGDVDVSAVGGQQPGGGQACP
jgi:hypothetical protein